MSEPQPQLWVIAGPNGSGKTSFARQYLPLYAHIRHFVNADLIAAGLSPFDPDAAALRAGRLMLAEIRRLADQRMDFAFETTLSGKVTRRCCVAGAIRGTSSPLPSFGFLASN